MITLAGIHLPDEAADLVQKYQDRVDIQVVPAVPEALLGMCQNCGGIKSIRVYVGTRATEPWSGLNFYTQSGWIHIDRRDIHSFWCPICSPDVAHKHLIDHCGLSADELGWRLDYIDGMVGKAEACHAARLIVAQDHPVGWLTLYGDYGVGKTGILKSVVAALVRGGVSAQYITAFDILERIKATFGGDSLLTSEATYDLFASYSFLGVDEVDRIPDKAWSRMAIMSVLDKRYAARNRVATLLATNSHPEHMGDDWGYLMSRMRDGPRILVGGVDLRGRKIGVQNGL